MGIAIKSEQDKPRSYKEGYDAVMESGLFEVNDFCKEQVSYIQMSDGTLQTCVLRYYPRGVLEKKFQGELPVSYDELTEQGAYIMMSVNDEEPAKLYDEPKQIEVGVMEKTVISDEEYANMSAADKENVKEYMNKNGLSRSKAESAARLTVADPGTSEHHTGLAFDVTVPGETFKFTKQCQWLHEHCWEYGFIIRYTDDKQDITGFLGEEWHIRYVGTEHSMNMKNSGLCLEEYLEHVQTE